VLDVRRERPVEADLGRGEPPLRVATGEQLRIGADVDHPRHRVVGTADRRRRAGDELPLAVTEHRNERAGAQLEVTGVDFGPLQSVRSQTNS